MSNRFVTLFVILTLIFTSSSFQMNLKKIKQYVPKQTKANERQNTARLLQIVIDSNTQAQQSILKIIESANSERAKNGIPPLSIQTSLNTLLITWSRLLKNSISISQYMQLYYFPNTQTYKFQRIPREQIQAVAPKLVNNLSSKTYNKVAYLFNRLQNGDFQVYIILSGGPLQQIFDFSKQRIDSQIRGIRSDNTKLVINTQGPFNSQSSKISDQSNGINLIKIAESPVTTPPNQNISENTQIIQRNNFDTNLIQVVQQNNISNSGNQILQTNTIAPLVQINQQNTQIQNRNNIETSSILPQSALVNQNSNQNNQRKIVIEQPVIVPQIPLKQDNISNSIVSQELTQIQRIKAPQPTPSFVPLTVVPQRNSLPVISTPILPTLPLITQTNFSTSTNFDRNIILTHSVPPSFVKDQIFAFKGYIITRNPNSVTRVNVIFTRVSDQRRMSFNQVLKANEVNFTIYAALTLTGQFFISVFRGSMGGTFPQRYIIQPRFIKSITSRPPQQLRSAQLNLIGNILYVNWTHSGNIKPALTKLRFTQGNSILTQVQLIVSNYESSFQVPYARFANFAPGLTNIQLSQAYSLRQSSNFRTSEYSAPFTIVFNAVQHQYDEIQGKSINSFPLRQPLNSILTLQGISDQTLLNEIILQTPKKAFKSYFINNKPQKTKNIPAQTNLNILIKLQEQGVYILQVNEAGGSAIVNVPIYVGDSYPFLPDFLDVSPGYNDIEALNQPVLLQDRRILVLALINNIRRAFGSRPVQLDNRLNNLAQDYANVLVQTNFLSHVDRQGRDPNDRASLAGISQGVGQNLALNNNLTQAQLMLQRSPIHLRNMINPLWTRVGLGITQNRNSNYYLVQQFSSRDLTANPLTVQQKRDIQRSIVRFVQKRNPQLRRQNPQLSSQLQRYQSLTSQPSLTRYLLNFGYRQVGVQNINVNYNTGNFLQILQNGPYLKPKSSYTQFGVTAMFTVNNNKNFIEIFVAYI